MINGHQPTNNIPPTIITRPTTTTPANSTASNKSNRASIASLPSPSPSVATTTLDETAEMFLKSAIERILADPSIKKKEHAPLKKACESALDHLQSELERHQGRKRHDQGPPLSPTANDVLPNQQDYLLADNYFLPFELACASKNTRIVVIALDCLQKLIAYGHLVGDTPDSTNPERLLIDRVVATVCAPFQGPHTDDAIQLQIIKAILALVLSNTCHVHEGSMLLAVRTCFNIYLASRSPVNQSTAKGILTQTINSVFNNMERRLEECEGSHGGEMDEDTEDDVRSVLNDVVNQVAVGEGEPLDESNPFSDNYKGNGRTLNGDLRGGDRGVLPRGINESSSSLNGGGNAPSIGSSSSNLDSTTLTAGSDAGNLPDEPGGMGSSSRLEFKFVEEKDAFLIFRALCKLSMKQLPSDNEPDPRSHELRSKLLSLDMILLVLQNMRSPLPYSHSFVFAVRHFLCVALTANAASPIIAVFEKALAIFVQLVNKWKIHLRRQLEVFFKEIVIGMLESNSSSFEHKWVVLTAVGRIFENSQSVVDIYVNYDCHLTSANVFESLVTHLSKLATGYAIDTPANASPLIKERDRRMRELALECLVKVLHCLVMWYEGLGQNGDAHPPPLGSTTAANNDFDSEHPAHQQTVNSTSSLSNGFDQLAQVKMQKSLIEQGIFLFAQKPKQGLTFLHDKGFVGNDPEAIAKFFHSEERLDKGVVGDYLGDGDEFNKRVMYAYIDYFGFAGISIVQALRTLLDKFRLPGEAQKIDRIMEKFASRYCECNPDTGIFASADTAYVLSYSIIMLTTDLHNAQVRQKMTREQYITMNRGINDQADLPDDFLSAIYDDIAANEIKTKPSATGRLKPKLNVASATWRQRKLFQNLELECIAHTAHALMEAASAAPTEFTTASQIDHVRPMFALIWTPCLAAFSIGLQSSDEAPIWRRCLQGFRYGIRVACIFRMNTQRNAYIQALARFTLLTAQSSLSEMKAKNVESIKILIIVGDEDGNFLDECWYDVLKTISQLELAQLIGSAGSNPVKSENIKHMFNINDTKSLTSIQECLGETSSQSVIVAVDKIFQGSSKLSGEAIVHFVRHLCRVSMEELTSTAAPRMFMLQKIVEISFYNMGRIRIEWSMIWSVLGQHFNLAGCSANQEISHFALDALRQLAMKFLEKGELPNFRFQKEFLRPFEVIMARNKSLECQEMVLACLSNMVASHSDRIRSGWKNIFALYTIAAGETRETLVEAAFKTTHDIMTRVFPEHFTDMLGSFQEAIKCLSEFACNTLYPDTSMESIRLIRLAATLVSKNTELINTQRSEDDHVMAMCSPECQRVWLKAWLPIIFELSCIINRCKLDVRTRSLTVMFEIIKTYGEEFRPEWWGDLFNIIFRIFDFIKLNHLGNEKGEWMMTTCNHALYAIVDVFSQYYDSLAPILLPDIYQQLFWCVQQGNEQLARSAINCLENLVLTNGEKFTEEMWERTVQLLIDIFHCSMPDLDTSPAGSIEESEEAKSPDSPNIAPQSPEKTLAKGPAYSQTTPSKLPGSPDSVLLSSITRCIIQMEVVDTVSNVLFGRSAFKVMAPVKKSSSYAQQMDASASSEESLRDVPAMFPHLSDGQLSRLIECLMASHVMARECNNNSAQRSLLWKAAYRGKAKPNLQKLEAHSIHCALNILFQLYAKTKVESGELVEGYRAKLIETVNYALDYYIASHSDTLRSYWLTVIQMLLNRSCDLPEHHFHLLGNDYRLSLCRLIDSEEQPIIRTALHRFVERSIRYGGGSGVNE